MKNTALAAFVLALGFAVPPDALAVVFRIGDTVYVDGKEYSWAQWKEIRDHYQAQADRTAPDPSAPRAASCITQIYYAEFPSEDERFQCSGGLGAMTREQILRRGWKIDLIEKIPVPAPTSPPAAGALYKYKLVLSCPDSCAAGSPQPGPEAKTVARPAPRPLLDNSCVDDCLGTGAARELCESRCTY